MWLLSPAMHVPWLLHRPRRKPGVQVVTAVDPFGYYAEGVQQHLDEAFTAAKGTSRCGSLRSFPPCCMPACTTRAVQLCLPTNVSTVDTAALSWLQAS